MIKMTNNDWDMVLEEEYKKEYFRNLVNFVNEVYNKEVVFPPKSEILRALSLTSYKDTKVVILGQDPYHGIGEANGLSFSVNDGVKLPPSLKNIFKELYDDLGISISSGDLSSFSLSFLIILSVNISQPLFLWDAGVSFFTVKTVLRSKPFSRTNNFLISNGIKPINWSTGK